MEVKLVMFKRDGTRKDFPVQGKNTVLGRGEECQLRIPLLSISRRHCEIIKDATQQLRLRDLASSNGTFVNNKRVNEALLKAGDRLAVGPVVFTLQIDGLPEIIKPAPAKPAAAARAAASPTTATVPLDEDEVIELEADVVEGDDVDPISALEALAEDEKEKK